MLSTLSVSRFNASVAARFFAANGNTGVVGPGPKQTQNGNTGVVPPGKTDNGNTGIVPPGKITDPVVRMQVSRTVASFLRQDVESMKPCAAPLNCGRFPSMNVNPMGEMGVNFDAFNINGELMLRRTAAGQSQIPASWFDLGKMPVGAVA